MKKRLSCVLALVLVIVFTLVACNNKGGNETNNNGNDNPSGDGSNVTPDGGDDTTPDDGGDTTPDDGGDTTPDDGSADTYLKKWNVSAGKNNEVFAYLYAKGNGYALHIKGEGRMKDFAAYEMDDDDIYRPWEDYCERITEAVIGDGVKNIGAAAFLGCKTLTSISIADSVAALGLGVFVECEGLTAVTLPVGIDTIPLDAFAGCKALTSIVIPNGVKTIEGEAFYDCESLGSITIPDSVTRISEGAFDGTAYVEDENNWENGVLYIGKHLIEAKDSFSGSYAVKDGTVYIGEDAFWCCEDLTSITIPDSVISIERDAFYGTGYYQNEENWENGALYIGRYLIDADPDYTGAFAVKEGTVSIASGIFCDYGDPTSIAIPSSVKHIGFAAFIANPSIMSITVESGNTVYHSEGNCLIETATGHLLATSRGSVIPNGVTSIGNGACSNMNASEIVIPEGVTRIGDLAFWGCEELISVTIPEGVTSIGYGAFAYSQKLESVTIPSSVTSIDSEAFDNCDALAEVHISDIGAWCNLLFGYRGNPLSCSDECKLYLNGSLVTALVIPEGVTRIAVEGFYGCSSLTSIVIPDSVTSIGSYAFKDCTSLTSITFGENSKLESIGYQAFRGCDSLESITIPDSVTSIGNSAFADCTGLTSITIPNSVTSIGNNAFMYAGIRSITIPEGVTSIGDYAFYGCSGLTSITIPDSVTSIGDWVFYGCSGLASIAIPDSVTSIGGWAFAYCSNLHTVTIGKGLQTVGEDIFAGCSSLVSVTIDPQNPYIDVNDLQIVLKHAVTFLDADGKTVAVLYVADGGAADTSAISISVPEGYTLQWENRDAIDPSTLDRIVSNATFVPVFSAVRSTVTITFVTNDGTTLMAPIVHGQIEYGAEAPIPQGYIDDISLFDDYVIIGWDSDGNGTADDGWKTVKEDMTVNAVFRAKEIFTVKFYGGEDGVVSCTVPVKEGEALDMSKVTYPPTVGRLFKYWENADSTDASTLDRVVSNASFTAVFAKINSVIPMVAKGTITVDGVKDAAYASGAYLPINEERHADRDTKTYEYQKDYRPLEKDGKFNGQNTSWITADAWIVWDGEYIYMLVEVSDKTLTYRNPFYVQTNVNPWANDSVALYFNFEQSSSDTVNKKMVTIDALGQRLFSNTIARYGECSTHFAEMEAAARSALGYYKNGVLDTTVTAGLTNDVTALKATDNAGVQYADTLNTAKNYSYRVEFKLVAKTEGVPDTENYPVDGNGRLPAGYILDDLDYDNPYYDLEVPEFHPAFDANDPAMIAMEYYRFTDGEQLKVGSFVRFSLQIIDLFVDRATLNDPLSGYYEGTVAQMQAAKEAGQPAYVYKNNTGTTAADRILPPFVPVGHTQNDLSKYVTFSLGGEGDVAKWEVYELKGNGADDQTMLDANGNSIVQGAGATVTVKTTAD